MRFLQAVVVHDEVKGFTRRTARYSRNKGAEFEITFVHPGHYDAWVAEGTDAWYLLGVAAAFAAGEDYTHLFPVDDELVRNSRALVRQWRDFFPGRRHIALNVHSRAPAHESGAVPGLTACLFTAGVDSSFTLAKHLADVDVLIRANFNFDKAAGYQFVQPAQARLLASTASYAKEGMIVGTNILWPFAEFADAWSFLTHGAALSAMGHLFAGKIGRVLISSSHAFGELIPWGSHPLTDPLFSSSRLKVEHFGATYSRFDKVVSLADHPQILEHLAVCGLPPDEKRGGLNCSHCQKCLRTMAALDLCDARGGISAFDWTDYSSAALAKIRLHHPNEYIFFEELIAAARNAGRPDIADAATHAIRRSSKYKPLVFAENVLRRRFQSVSRTRALKRLKRSFYRAVGG